MGKIIFVTGGANSGKSEFAEELTVSLGGNTTYIATSNVLDSEMEEKRKKHLIRRQKYSWSTIEAYKDLGTSIRRDNFSQTYILDCIGMLVSNYIFEDDFEFDATDKRACLLIEEKLNDEIVGILDSIKAKDINFVFVSNEIGMGLIADSALNRYYSKLLGEINKKIARVADEVYLVVSGIQIRIK